MCRSSSPGRGNFFLLRADPRASAEKGVVVFTGHGQNDAGGHFHHETNERYLLQKLRLFRVAAFFIADVWNGLILSFSSEVESTVCSHTPCRYDRVFSASRIGFGSAFAQVRRDHRSEVVHPASNSFVGHHDTEFRQQIFDVAEAQGKPDVKPDRLLDDFQREPVPFVADFLHPPGYLTASEAASPNRRDKAFVTLSEI